MNRTFVVAALGLLAFAAPASAQYYPPGYNPYNPYVGRGPGYNYGAAASGQADLTRAQGQVAIDNENARIQREKANQAKLDTKRQAFDEMNYEKANTPSYGEIASKDKAQLVQRLMKTPTRTEVYDGKTLNAMLPYCQYLSSHGTQGPPVLLSQTIVNQLNISGVASSTVGMLKAGGQVEWPLALRGPESKKLDELLPKAYNATIDGSLDNKLMKQVRTEMKKMRDTLGNQFRSEEIDGTSFVRGLEFYNSLSSSVDALERPDAKKQLSGSMSPRARNVQELLDYMGENGFKFGPAMPGQESAYQVTHDAFVRYARTAESSSGLVVSPSSLRH
jgi:hypothetical protein